MAADLPPTGFKNATPLPTPTAFYAAGQARQMGLGAGAVIVGRQGNDEAELTLIFVGRRVVVCNVRTRTVGARWSFAGESASWSLCCRRWFLKGGA